MLPYYVVSSGAKGVGLRVHLLVNPRSGRGKAVPAAERLVRELHHQQVQTRTTVTRSAEEAAQVISLLRRDSVDTLVVVGGDGTVNNAVNHLQDDIAIAPVPLGTANVLARELGLPWRKEQLAQLILRGPRVKMDLGEINGHRFMLMAGVGLDAQVVAVVDALRREKAISMTSYVGPTLRAIRNFKIPMIIVKTDCRELYRGRGTVIVTNVRHYGGPFQIHPAADYADGYLDVIVFKPAHVASYLRYCLQILTGSHLGASDVEATTARQVEVIAEPPTAVQIDGEVFGPTPLNVRVLPKAVTMVAGAVRG